MTIITTATKTKLIRVNEEVHSELVKLCEYGDSMNHIIEMLLQSYHHNNTTSTNGYNKLAEEKFISKVAREVGDNLKPVRKRQRY